MIESREIEAIEDTIERLKKRGEDREVVEQSSTPGKPGVAGRHWREEEGKQGKEERECYYEQEGEDAWSQKGAQISD